MKKIILILCFNISSTWALSCSESASFITLLKLKDMVTAYSYEHFYEVNAEKEIFPSDVNIYEYKEVCNKDEVEDILNYASREKFKHCSLQDHADSLDITVGTLETESFSSLMSNHIDGESCSPKDKDLLKERLVSAAKKIEKELKKDKANLKHTCHIAREAFLDNVNVRKRCE